MKKSLLAIAAMTAFAGAAQAQSSVTVYGILDVGFTGADSKGLTSTTAGVVPNTQIKKTSAQFGQSAETTSRLGFKGSEDLGGGLSGIFTAEFQLYPQSGTLSSDAPNSTSGTGLVNRQTFVGLSKKGLGQAAIGTQYTPVFQSVAASDPGQTNNVVGSIIYPARANSQDVSVPSFTVRQNNAITFNTEKFAGFSVKGMYSQNNSDSTQNGLNNTVAATATNPQGGTFNTNGWGLGADYSWKKLYVVAAYQSLKNESNVTGSTPISTNATVSNGVNTSSNEAYAAATYDFGIAKAYVNWVSRKVNNVIDSNQYAKRSGQQLGVRSFITPTIEAWASIGNGRYQSYGIGEPTANINAWQLGSNYLLSKRTNLYAIYGKAQTSNVVNTTAGIGGSASASQYAVGVRHTF